MKAEAISKKFENIIPQERVEEHLEKDGLKDRIEKEQAEASERFSDLINLVSERYGNLPELMKEDFILHNEEILRGVIELAMENDFSPEELKILEISAILHDMAKADKADDKYMAVPNYDLAVHAEKAAAEVPALVTDEYLTKAGLAGDFEKMRKEIQDAIRQHMGPHPGFMTAILEGVNAKLREIGEKEIEHPSAHGKISEALLAADMQSLSGAKGRNKVLSIRANVEYFKKQDSWTAFEYAQRGIDLSRGEAALLSGFESAMQARDMIKNEKYRQWVDAAIEESKEMIYRYPGNPQEGITWQRAEKKRLKLEDKKRIAMIRKKLIMSGAVA